MRSSLLLRNLRISLRLSLAIIALMCFWLATVVNRASRQRRAVESVQLAGGEVRFDYEMIDAESLSFDREAEPFCPRWIRERLGEDLFRTAKYVSFNNKSASVVDVRLGDLVRLEGLFLNYTQATDRDVAQLVALNDLRYLDVSATRISDDALAYISQLQGLELLYLVETDLSDAGCRHLGAMSSLRDVNLMGTDVTDAGIAQLVSLSNLENLVLTDTRISDRSVASLSKLQSLKMLWLTGTEMTGGGIEELKAQLPGCEIR